MVKTFLRSMLFAISAWAIVATSIQSCLSATYDDFYEGPIALKAGWSVKVDLPNGRSHTITYPMHYYDDYRCPGSDFGSSEGKCDCEWNFNPSAPITEIRDRGGKLIPPGQVMVVRQEENPTQQDPKNENKQAVATTSNPINEATQAALTLADEGDQWPVQNSEFVISPDAVPTLTDNLVSVEKETMSSQSLGVASNEEAFLVDYDEATQQRKLSPKASPLSEEDPILAELVKRREAAVKKAEDAKAIVAQQALILELMRQEEQALKEAQEAEAVAADQSRQIEQLMALLNSSAKVQQSQQAPQASSVLTPHASASVPSPVVSDIAIPEVTKGYEKVYERFLGGKLIYTDPTSKAKTEFSIRALANPLEGTFDLSGCGDTGQYLSISTGYRKGVKAKNSNKTEIWLAPRFLVEREIATTAKHLQPIMGSWDAVKAPVGLFWTWGSSSDLDWYDYFGIRSKN